MANFGDGKCDKCGSEDLGYDEREFGYSSEDGFIETGWTETDFCKVCGFKVMKSFSSDVRERT